METLGQLVVSWAENDSNIYVWEGRSLTVLGQFEQHSSLSQQSLVYTHDLLLAAQANKTILHYYKFGKEMPEKKSTTLGKISVLANNHWMVLGGSFEGDIYFWDFGSGCLLHSWNAHFNKVTSLTVCEAYIVSGGEDASIKVFLISNVLAGNYSPFRTLSAHLMKVTSLVVAGNFLYSTSLDKSFKVHCNWELEYEKFLSSEATALEVTLNKQKWVGTQSGEVGYSSDQEFTFWNLNEGPVNDLKHTQNILLVACNKVLVLDPETGTQLKAFILHTGRVAGLLCIERKHPQLTSIKPLKKQQSTEPTTLDFAFKRTKYTVQEEPTPETNSEELQNLQEINSTLYKLLVEQSL